LALLHLSLELSRHREDDAIGQAEWVEELKQQLFFPTTDRIAASILDSGANRTHSLLEKSLDSNDLHTCNPTWGVGDNPGCGHGTAMAGLVLYGDLQDALTSSNPIELSYQLESVKILPPQGQNDPELYGAITQEAVARVEIQAPHRKRVFCMAVTNGGQNVGYPSSWSAAIDQLCFGEVEIRRLMILPVGNIRDDILLEQYIDRNDTEAAENPSQAWNALVVGAYTEKVNIVSSTMVRTKLGSNNAVSS
jgi:Subtilase family